ncbi:hypothetical protein V1281_002617 [Nitrobacteraceae bacterium AZCC 2161]
MSSELTIPMLVRMANANISPENGLPAVQRLIDDAELVVAIWQDWTQPFGVATLIIKGDNIFREAVAEQRTLEAKISSIRCIDAAQAFALLDICGHRAVLQ